MSICSFYFYNESKGNKLRQNLIKKYKNRFFIKKKWKEYFYAEIIVIDDKNFKNENIFKYFFRLPNTKILILRNCNLKEIPEMPNLRKLFTSNTCLEKLPSLPKCRQIYVSCNKLKVIPYLPKSQKIHCEYNILENIHDIPNCRELICNDNKLSTLPNLPKCRILDCSNNNLQSFSYLPKCKQLILKNNPIEKLFINNTCKVKYMGKSKLHIIRFFTVKAQIFQYLIQFNKFYHETYKEKKINTKDLQKINFMNSSYKNLLFLQKIISENYQEMLLNHIIQDDKFVSDFIQFKL